MNYEEAANRTEAVYSWEDMKKFGIQILTGEACGIGMRILCDLNEDGKKVMEDFLGGRVAFDKDGSWNNTVNGKPAVASVMLTVDLLTELAAFCLLSNGFDVVAVHVVGCQQTTALGLQTEGKYGLDDFMKALGLERGNGFRTYQAMGTRGTRNQHVMSGRVS